MADPRSTHRDTLVARLGADAVRWDDETLVQHSHDYWCLGKLRLLRGTLTARPSCVVSPDSTDQVVRVLE